MAGKDDIHFVNLNILENWRFWNEYAKSGDYEAAGREAIAQANALLAQDMSSNKRAAELLSEGRAFKMKKAEAGRKGGRESARVRWGFDAERVVEASEPARPTQKSEKVPPPRDRDEVYDFCVEMGIPEGYGVEWYNQNMPRGFKDKNGRTIRNWKGALVNYFKAESGREDEDD